MEMDTMVVSIEVKIMKMDTTVVSIEAKSMKKWYHGGLYRSKKSWKNDTTVVSIVKKVDEQDTV